MASETTQKALPRSSRERRGAIIRTWAPVLLLVVIPVFLVALHVHAYTKLSPIDELQHIDYMFRSPGLHPVIAGTKDGQSAMREQACRGIDAVFTNPPCSDKALNPSQFQDQGYDTAYIHPPTYYDLTWAAGEVVKHASGSNSWVTAWRLVGALWLAAGLVLTYLAGLRMGVARVPLVGLLVLLSAAPSILQTDSTVTPDATSTFIGGAVLYLACRWEEGGRWRWLALVAIGFVGTAFKLQDAIIVMMICAYFLLRARGATPSASVDPGASKPPPMPDPRSAGLLRQATRLAVRIYHNAQAGAVGIVLLTTLAIAATWTIAQRVTQTIDPNTLLVNKQFVVSSISVQDIVSTFGVFLAPIPGAYVPTSLQNVWTTNMVSVLSWLLIAGVVGGSIFVARSHAVASLARATLLLALLGGPIFVVLNYLSMHQYIPMPSRYGFTLLPAMVLCTADAIRLRWAGVCVLGTGLLGVALAAYQMA